MDPHKKDKLLKTVRNRYEKEKYNENKVYALLRKQEKMYTLFLSATGRLLRTKNDESKKELHCKQLINLINECCSMHQKYLNKQTFDVLQAQTD